MTGFLDIFVDEKKPEPDRNLGRAIFLNKININKLFYYYVFKFATA